MVVRVPLDLRLVIVSLTPWIDSLFPVADEAIELTADLVTVDGHCRHMFVQYKGVV